MSDIADRFEDAAVAMEALGAKLNTDVLAHLGGGSGLTKQSRVLQEVLTKAAASEGRTRWHFLPLSDVPTLTGSTSEPDPAVFNRFYSCDITGSTPWQVNGGYLLNQPTQGETWGKRIVTGRVVNPGPGLPDGVYTGRSGAIVVEFTGDELIYMLEAHNMSYQFLIEEDGAERFLDKDGLGITPVGTDINDRAYYKLSFSTVKTRKITLQCNANESHNTGSFVDPSLGDLKAIGRFGGIFTKEHHIITRPRYSGPRIGGMGDSNIQGTNGPSSEGYLSVAFNHLGLTDTWISALGASGAFAGPSANATKWHERRQVWQDGKLDIMVWSISWNDWTLVDTATTIALEMAELDACREQFPDMIIVMVGLHTNRGPGVPDFQASEPDGSWILDVNNGMKAAIEAREDPYMKYLDTSSLYEAPFVGGETFGTDTTGHAGTGDLDVNFGPSGHYSRAGDRRIGRAIGERLYDIFRNMYYGIDAEIVEYGTEPVLTLTSSSQLYVAGTAKSVEVATCSFPVMTSIASVTPALPSGLTASIVVAGTKLKLAGTAAAAVAATNYVFVVNVKGGGTVTVTLPLTVAAAPFVGYAFDVTFNGASTDTSLTDAEGAVWTPVGGATLDGVVPSGGGFQTTTAAALAKALLGTNDFSFEIKFKTTVANVTLGDLGVALGLPMFCGLDGSSTNPRACFYSNDTGFIGASMHAISADFASGTDYTLRFYREAGTQKSDVGGFHISWGDTSNETDYSVEPTKITLGTRQGDATNRPFAGTIYYAKLKVGAI